MRLSRCAKHRHRPRAAVQCLIFRQNAYTFKAADWIAPHLVCLAQSNPLGSFSSQNSSGVVATPRNEDARKYFRTVRARGLFLSYLYQ